MCIIFCLSAVVASAVLVLVLNTRWLNPSLGCLSLFLSKRSLTGKCFCYGLLYCFFFLHWFIPCVAVYVSLFFFKRGSLVGNGYQDTDILESVLWILYFNFFVFGVFFPLCILVLHFINNVKRSVDVY